MRSPILPPLDQRTTVTKLSCGRYNVKSGDFPQPTRPRTGKLWNSEKHRRKTPWDHCSRPLQDHPRPNNSWKPSPKSSDRSSCLTSAWSILTHFFLTLMCSQNTIPKRKRWINSSSKTRTTCMIPNSKSGWPNQKSPWTWMTWWMSKIC